MPITKREGLLWDESGFDLVPRWQSEPSIESIRAVCQRELHIAGSEDCVVSFLNSGAFNKLYLIERTNHPKLIIRVSLPVDPQRKTAGEVETLRWIRHHTTIPVPEVIAFDDSSANEIGYEWIIMEMMPGTSAYHRWRKMSMATKEALVEKVADFQAQLYGLAGGPSMFRGIGTLKRSSGRDAAATSPDVVDPAPDRLVSRPFFWGENFNYDVPRGPFCSSHDWLDSYIKLIVEEQKVAKEDAEDEDEKEDAEYSLELAHKLAGLLPKIFPRIQEPAERTVLVHEDLSLNNILVDENDNITAFIDWEFVSAMPYWVATKMPQLLVTQPREEEPVRDKYADETAEEVERDKRYGHDDLDNEGKNQLYWIHLLEYEKTQLKKAYTQRMRQSCHLWDADVADGRLKLDFVGAVSRCASGWFLGCVEDWIDAVEGGQYPRLEDLTRKGGT